MYLANLIKKLKIRCKICSKAFITQNPQTLKANPLPPRATEKYNYLLHEYRDLFIDMAVRNNRSKLAIASRQQER